MAEDLASKFKSIGLSDNTVADTIRNAKLSAVLSELIDVAGGAGSIDKSTGALVYAVATRVPNELADHRKMLATYVRDRKLKSTAQLEAAVKFLEHLRIHGDDLNVSAFEQAAGIGVVVTDADIVKAAEAVLASHKAQLQEHKWSFTIGKLYAAVNAQLKWADGGRVKAEVDKQLAALLGEKPAESAKPKAAAADKKPAAPKPTEGAAAPAAAAAAGLGDGFALAETADLLRDKWPAPQENPYNDPETLKAHLKRTGGRVLTRFPPEPNGYLHIGHAKAMHIDFGQAIVHGGDCYLRYDDTNPAAEKQEYIDAIQENVAWMGYKPFKITFASDYFQELYDMAVKLIKKGLAYVCHQTVEEMRRDRELKVNSPWRDRPIEESLREFENMRRGKYAEGEVTLRCKIDMQSPNPCMRDFVAYRVLYQAHPHAGDRWCIYPSYDFTHCINDSIEDITHSLCTLEFNIRRESYYWLLDALEIYKPIVWEYSRLNLTHTMVSKRLLKALVERGVVRGWDDPRMPTLMAMRRRGYTPAAIKNFCERVGVTRSMNTIIPYSLLELCVRADLDANAARTMVVLSPLKVTITNYPADKHEVVDAPLFPRDASLGSYGTVFGRVVYIDRSDFRLMDDKDYKGLAPNKEVGLKYAYSITCTRVIQDAGGNVTELEATYQPDRSASKPKGFLHWVADLPSYPAARAEVRLYDHLFTLADLSEMGGGDFMPYINPHSEIVIKDALVASNIAAAAGTAEKSFQAERVGYFCVDKESAPGKLVLNRVVTLHEETKEENLAECLDTTLKVAAECAGITHATLASILALSIGGKNTTVHDLIKQSFTRLAKKKGDEPDVYAPASELGYKGDEKVPARMFIALMDVFSNLVKRYKWETDVKDALAKMGDVVAELSGKRGIKTKPLPK